MIKIKEEYIVDKDGKPSAVILRMKDYKKLLDMLEDLSDSRYIKEHKKEKRLSLDAFVKQLEGEKIV